MPPPLHEPRPHNDVVLVRHGATEWSESGRHTGRTDLPLTEQGSAQGRAVATLLAGWSFAIVLCSPLARARETCSLAGYARDAQLTDDLCEWDYGDYEGLTTAEIRQDVPGWTVWSHDVRGGESIEQVARRADRVIERALDADGDVVLFAHGHILRVLAARWCELAPQDGKRLALGTGTRSVLGWEREYRTIREWNSR
jgi:probable phosphoglycerate mutase